MDGVGVMATASSAAVFSLATDGVDAGLMAAPCLAPGTTHWFTGLGATDADRTELILTNADDTQASGRPAVLRAARPGRGAGQPGPGDRGPHDLAYVSLASLVKVEGPLGLAVQASQGRVTAVAKRTRSDDLKPVGADWQVPSPSPALSMVIPGVPEDAGPRELVVTNPGTDAGHRRGPGARPAGSVRPELAPRPSRWRPESSATVDLATGSGR